MSASPLTKTMVMVLPPEFIAKRYNPTKSVSLLPAFHGQFVKAEDHLRITAILIETIRQRDPHWPHLQGCACGLCKEAHNP